MQPAREAPPCSLTPHAWSYTALTSQACAKVFGGLAAARPLVMLCEGAAARPPAVCVCLCVRVRALIACILSRYLALPDAEHIDAASREVLDVLVKQGREKESCVFVLLALR